jgi:hypothetical protein
VLGAAEQVSGLFAAAGVEFALGEVGEDLDDAADSGGFVGFLDAFEDVDAAHVFKGAAEVFAILVVVVFLVWGVLFCGLFGGFFCGFLRWRHGGALSCSTSRVIVREGCGEGCSERNRGL